MCRMIITNVWHWNVNNIQDGINHSDKIEMTYNNRLDLEKELIKGDNIHFIRWIINPSPWSIDLVNQYRKTEKGIIHPFLWQDKLPEWLVRKICKSNWTFYKKIINPTYKIKKDYFNFISNAKLIKKYKINSFVYNLYKPIWDYKNSFNDRLLKRNYNI